MYDDVALLSSDEPRANLWRLEGQRSSNSPWEEIPARIGDAHFNCFSDKLEFWEHLRAGDKTAVAEAFETKRGWPKPAFPFEIRWDISHWYFGLGLWYQCPDRQIRFVDPEGEAHEVSKFPKQA